ncbi:uncharacterized protein LOC130646998 [Hydractinia symbiolongicarpus]|uniref:uncharacterized protein LOC130646998 n=1 Tax=Hydractinia symbiolongicarpus TaxID=13093 RepID=UPI00254B4E2B|nr:uncharacterized protein LOC130646998 [Hydractinia symbiolongicarpus]
MSILQDQADVATIKTLFPRLSNGEIEELFSSFTNNNERVLKVTNYLLDCQGNTGNNATNRVDGTNSLPVSSATTASTLYTTSLDANAVYQTSACASNTTERLHNNTANLGTNSIADGATTSCDSSNKSIATDRKREYICVNNSNVDKQILDYRNKQSRWSSTHSGELDRCESGIRISGHGFDYGKKKTTNSKQRSSSTALSKNTNFCSSPTISDSSTTTITSPSKRPPQPQDDSCIITDQQRGLATNEQCPSNSSNVNLPDENFDDYDFKWYWKEASASDDKATRFEKWSEEKLEQIYRIHNGNFKLLKVMLRRDRRIERFQVNFSTMRLLCKKVQWHLKRVKVSKQKKNPTEEKEKVETPYPSTWEEQRDDRELFTVPVGGSEWLDVCQLFNGTLDNMKNAITVTKVERVQNRWLWRKYCLQKKLMIEKNGENNVNEKLLFHGTRSNHPVLIWKGENSFDLRHCHSGNWGKGAYFAEKAAYSINYAYKSGNGEKQIFMANVLTGFNIMMEGDCSLQLPPVRRTDSNGVVTRFDSVSGLSWGYKIYVLYQLDVAYPSYLITYQGH